MIEITPEVVVGRDVETDEEITWDRKEIERGLAHGKFSTNLTDFEWISVYQVGRWREFDAEADYSDLRYRGQPYISVIAYGENGLKYGRRYRFAELDPEEINLWKEDVTAGGFNEDTVRRLNEIVHAALDAEGYTVVDAPRSD